MTQLVEKHFAAAGALANLVATRIGSNNAMHPETAIAAAARMAGLMLFRSFGFDTSRMEPGAVVLSEVANEHGPALVNIVFAVLRNEGLELDESKLGGDAPKGGPPALTFLETQSLLERDFSNVRDQHKLSFLEAAHCAAIATAFLIKHCASQLSAEQGFGLATYSFIEGSKTVPAPFEQDK